MFVSERLLAFRTGPEKHNFPCRKRSESRLKNNTSCTDIRIWSLDCEDRRKAFLDLFRTCHKCPRIGNYVPIYEALKASGVNVPKVKEPDPPFIRGLRFIFKNFYPCKEEKSTPSVTRGKEGKVQFGSGQKALMPQDEKEDYFGQSQYAMAPRSKARAGQKLTLSGHAEAEDYVSVRPGRRNINMDTVLPMPSYSNDFYGPSTEPQSEMSFITGLSTAPTSSGRPIYPGYRFDDQSTLGTDYTQSTRELTNSELSRFKRLHGDAHTSPEMCSAMCSYLKNQLKHFHELMFQRDLLMKQLEYHEQNLPRKIKLLEQSRRAMVQSGQASQASSVDEIYFSRRLQKISTHSVNELKLNDTHRGLKKKSTKVHLVKSSVFTTRSVSGQSVEDNKKKKYLSGRDLSDYSLEEFDKFVSEVKHVLSGVLKKFEISDDTVESMSEEMFIRSCIEETEYRVDLIQDEHRSDETMSRPTSSRTPKRNKHR